MVPASVVILQPDARLARELSSVLAPHFDSVHVATNLKDFCDAVGHRRPRAVVLDMESVAAEDLGGLRRHFPGVSIICTHRLPDDEMWMRALEAGAMDVCPTYDPASVVSAVLRTAEESRDAA
jgi:DNA-binding NtrC family response regulator